MRYPKGHPMNPRVATTKVSPPKADSEAVPSPSIEMGSSQDFPTTCAALPPGQPTGGDEAHALPDVLPGHWSTTEGREMAERYAAMGREQLMMGDRPDLGLANAVFMVDRDSLDLVALQTAAKERIRWLSVQLALMDQRLAEAQCALTKAAREKTRAVDDLCRWRSAIQAMTPGGSEFMDPEAVREWAQMLKRETAEAKLEVARLRKDARAALSKASGAGQ